MKPFAKPFAALRTLGLLALLLAPATLLPATAARAESQIFESPRIQGKLLDWCYDWAADCGQKPADRFCAMNNFAKASDFGQRPGPLGEPTLLMGDGQTCDGPGCDSFEFIACEAKTQPQTSTAQRFEKPQIKGIRIDWCYDFAKNCGQKAADRICSMHGFAKASAAKIEQNIGHTILLSTGQECSTGQCDGFAYVDCTK